MGGVQEAVLGLLTAKPDYGYGVAKQLEGSWSSAAIYKAIQRLHDRKLIEPAGDDGRRKLFQITPEGLRFHAARVAGMLMQPDEISARLLTIPAEEIPRVIDEYERQLLAEIAETPRPGAGGAVDLVVKHRLLVNEAHLKWIAWARRSLGATEA